MKHDELEELVGRWPCPSTAYLAAYQAWRRYHVETELFDREVCRSRNPETGDAVPCTAEERLVCSRYARLKREAVLQELRPWAAAAEDMERARRDVAQESTQRLLRELVRELGR